MNVKEINLKVTLKDKLRKIKFWKRLEDENFEGITTVSIKLSSDILNSYNCFENEKITLSYYIAKNFVGYNKDHLIYLLTESDFKESIKNDYKVISVKNDQDYYLLARKLLEHGIDVIPLDDLIYVKLEEETSISLNNDKVFKAKDIM